MAIVNLLKTGYCTKAQADILENSSRLLVWISDIQSFGMYYSDNAGDYGLIMDEKMNELSNSLTLQEKEVILEKLLLPATSDGERLGGVKVGAGLAMDDTTGTMSVSVIPAGMIMPSARPDANVPAGWLLCDGSEVDRTVYANLYAAIADTYGPGDGATTFNLPDMRDTFIRGAGGTLGVAIGTKQLDGVPDFNASFNIGHATGGGTAYLFVQENLPNNAIHIISNGGNNGDSGVTENHGGDPAANIKGSYASPSYGRDATTEVRPTNYAMNYFIKY